MDYLRSRRSFVESAAAWFGGNEASTYLDDEMQQIGLAVEAEVKRIRQTDLGTESTPPQTGDKKSCLGSDSDELALEGGRDG